MTRRAGFVACVVAVLALPAGAWGNAVLLEGDAGAVVPTVTQSIRAEIHAQVATTEVTTSFAPLSEPDALFCFGVPERAAAYELVLIVDGEELAAEAAVGDAGEYPESMEFGQAELLAGYLGDNPLRAWVVEQPAGVELTFRLTYVELLPYSFGEVGYRFPLIPFLDDAAPIERLAFELELITQRTIEGIDVSLPGADVEQLSSAHATVAATLDDATRAADVVVAYHVAPTELGIRAWAYRPANNPWVDESDGYFLLLLEPPAASDEVSDKVFTYVLDRSGSMSGDKIVDARNAAITAIEGLNAGDRFNVLVFDDRLVFFAPRPLEATAAHREDAIAFVESIDADGLTAIHAALLAGLAEDVSAARAADIEGGVPVRVHRPGGGCSASTGDEGAVVYVDDDAAGGVGAALPRVMLFLTDGLPTVGVEDPARILEDVGAANELDAAIYSVAIGGDADARFLGALAESNRGASVTVTAGDDLQAQLESLFFRINNPLLVRPELDLDGGATHDVLPELLPDLFLGNQLVIVGRYAEPGPLQVELTGTLDGAPASFAFDDELPAAEEHHVFVARIWAVTMVNHLLARIAAEGELPALVDQVVALGTAYGINTPYTPFTFAPPADEGDYGAADAMGGGDCSCDLDLRGHGAALPCLVLLAGWLMRRRAQQVD